MDRDEAAWIGLDVIMRTLALIGLMIPACGSSPEDPDDPTPVRVSCERTDRLPESGVIGISDPNTLDDGVIELIDDTGARWVRAEIHWSVVEPLPGQGLDFSDYDAMIDGYTARGIRVQAILTYVPPAYERDWDAIEDGFRRFATQAVERYAARGVHHWEVFNEPNLTGYGWLADGDDAATNLPNYVRLLGVANAVVRAHDPDGFVIIGGIASDQHRGLALEDTMRVVYEADAGACFDIFAYHPYGYQNRFAEARARVQDVLDAHGDSDVPVWFNEYGWTDQASMDLGINDTAETNPMMATFAQRDVADALFWFSAKDYSGRANAPTFGLADFELNRRPSFTTFQALVAEAQE